MEPISEKKIMARFWILWNLQLFNLFRNMTGGTF